MVHSKHTTKVFDSDLQELARAIAEMGGLAERQIAEAIEALATRDSGPARRSSPPTRPSMPCNATLRKGRLRPSPAGSR
jgi:phosphate uptake regulator